MTVVVSLIENPLILQAWLGWLWRTIRGAAREPAPRNGPLRYPLMKTSSPGVSGEPLGSVLVAAMASTLNPQPYYSCLPIHDGCWQGHLFPGSSAILVTYFIASTGSCFKVLNDHGMDQGPGTHRHGRWMLQKCTERVPLLVSPPLVSVWPTPILRPRWRTRKTAVLAILQAVLQLITICSYLRKSLTCW